MTIPRPTNDQCKTARRLQAGEPITGISNGAWPHGLLNDDCSLNAHSRGLFYSIEGTGEPISLTLRPDISDGKLEVAVLSQDDCGKCIIGSEFFSAEDMKHTVAFPSTKNEIYTVVVSGEGVSDAGVFQLSLTEQHSGDHKKDTATEPPFSGAGPTSTPWPLTILLLLIISLFAYGP